MPGLMASKGITCEGLPSGRTPLIRHGVLTGCLASWYESQRLLRDPRRAEKLGGADDAARAAALVPRNGFRFGSGGGRQFDQRPGTAATNVVVESADGVSRDELLRRVGNGLYVGRIWYTYPINGLRAGDFTCTVVADSYIIRDGRIAEPIKPNTIRINDNIATVLNNVVGVTKDVKGTIVWSSSRLGNHDLFTMDTDGSHVKAITHGDAVDWFPRFSPDGSKILFCRSKKGWVSERAPFLQLHALSWLPDLPRAIVFIALIDGFEYMMHRVYHRFDWLWCGNVLHHIPDTQAALKEFARVVKPGGRIVIMESQTLPAMFLPGHPSLERRIQEAESERSREEAGARTFQERRQRTLEALREANLADVAQETHLLQCRAPLTAAARAYIETVVFGRNWGERLRPLLSSEDWARRAALCDPQSAEYVLARPDYYCLYPITVFTARNRA